MNYQIVRQYSSPFLLLSDQSFSFLLIVVLDETLLILTNKCRQNLKNLTIEQLVNRCNETLHSVQDISRMYRKTNRDVCRNSYIYIYFFWF